MRTFKFRGKGIKSGQWFYGSVVPFGNSAYIFKMLRLLRMEHAEVDPETIGQFTGLKDKNGVEVYEGDIIEWTETHYHAIGVVAWREQIGIKDTEAAYNVGWCVEEYKGKVTYIIAPSAVPHGVVVGNVHDNYELLKGEQE